MKGLPSLVAEDAGTDLVEYALLTAFLGFAGVAAFAAIRGLLGDAYAGYNASAVDLAEPLPPGTGGGKPSSPAP
jgi:Flp pilus assembly pilin Flp